MCFADPDPAILHSTLFVNAFVREKIALVAIAGIPGFRFSVKIHEDEIGVAPEPGSEATVVPPADLSPCPRGVPVEEDGAIHVAEPVTVVGVCIVRVLAGARLPVTHEKNLRRAFDL